MESILIAVLTFIAGAALAAMFAPKRGVSPKELEKAKQDSAALAARCQLLEEYHFTAKEQLDAARKELLESHGRLNALEAEKKALEGNKQELLDMQEQMKLQFESLAAKVMEKNSAAFNEQSQKHLGDVLNPLKERLNDFKKQVEDSFGKQRDEQITLKTQIENIMQMSGKLSAQTENLTKALKGDVKAQGNWGEVILERILEEAQLEKGRDYILQGEGLGMKYAEDGSAQKPDVIVNLPDGKHLIIDSKVSLKHYELYCSADDNDPMKDAYFKQYLASVRAHVKGLSDRRYQENEKMRTPAFVMLFMPIEGAYSLAVQKDAELHSYAWNMKVAIVCPTTLFATMQTVHSLWKLEDGNRNVEEILKRGGELHDKFALFIDSLQDVGTQIDKARHSYDQAINRLSTGKGSVTSQVAMLKKLGAKASKTLPRELITEGEEVSAEILPIAS